MTQVTDIARPFTAVARCPSLCARAPWRRMILDPRLGAHVLCFELSDEPSETRWERRRECPVSHEAALGCGSYSWGRTVMAKLINELLLLTCMGGFIASDNLIDLMKDFSLSAIPASVVFSMRARGSASTSAHHASPVGSCGCNHERRSTASRAWSIARNRVAISGNVQSSRTKFAKCAPHR
jgi:hypothetical protein